MPTRRVVISVCAFVSFVLLQYAGARNPSLVLKAVMSVWVLAPFALMEVAAARWGRLDRWTRILSIAMTAVFIIDTIHQLNSKAAFVYVIVPPISALLFAASAIRANKKS